jgi:hypothetical protein
MLKRYRLADLTRTVPMPDRGGRLFSRDPRGETVDTENSFYMGLIADRDIVAVADDPAPPASEKPAAMPRGKTKGN